MRSPKSRTVRRSVALPQEVVDEARAAAPAELKENLNRLVIVSLREFAARRRSLAFDRAMEAMGADPAIQAECEQIEQALAGAEADGLADD